jgi:hypothetical protein
MLLVYARWEIRLTYKNDLGAYVQRIIGTT